jgi:para-aminobenzoate synthetase component 1
MIASEIFNLMNDYGRHRLPFFFVINYDMSDGLVLPFENIDSELILFDINGNSNLILSNSKLGERLENPNLTLNPSPQGEGLQNQENETVLTPSLLAGRVGVGYVLMPSHADMAGVQSDLKQSTDGLVGVGSDFYFRKFPIDFEIYKKAFNKVIKNINYGNSYLTNLTFQTKIELNLNLFQLFSIAKAKYKLYFEDKFVCCSPECFVKIIDGEIYSYPMKGTIDDSIPDALNLILNDEKEKAEHLTIVDLIRNDLSIVSKNVRVTKFRYPDYISTNQKNLIQISSEIKGSLPEDYQLHIGDIFRELLPAGSVTGAPKKKTIEIIKSTENYDRGFYTGVFGIFDGQNLDSAVSIRFIETSGENLYYKSGGGITYLSKEESEYQELIDKIYVPIN